MNDNRSDLVAICHLPSLLSAWMESEKLLSSGFLDENDMEDTTYISHSHIYARLLK